MATEPLSGPRAKDRVRAITDNRAAKSVEGLLMFRYVEHLHEVRVWVADGNEEISVIPSSIHVLEPSGQSAAELALEFSYYDLDEARSKGLITDPPPITGIPWSEMWALTNQVLSGFLATGWTIDESSQEELEPDLGDITVTLIKREGETLDVELRDDGLVSIWDMSVNGSEIADDDEGPPPVLEWRHPDDYPRDILRDLGWL